MRFIIAIAVAASLAASGAYAGKKEADACASKLNSEERKIYTRVIPNIVAGEKAQNRAMIRATVKKMNAKGELNKVNTKAKVKAVAVCINKLGA